MKKFLITAAVVLGVSFNVTTPTLAGDPVGPKLTDRLKELLATEMAQVGEATSELAHAIATGDHETVKDLGARVRDSFILKQSLTPEDKKDLVGAVPKAFLVLDKRFHGMAGKMALAAEAKDTELELFYYGQMLEACTQCHARFASDRFTGFGG